MIREHPWSAHEIACLDSTDFMAFANFKRGFSVCIILSNFDLKIPSISHINASISVDEITRPELSEYLFAFTNIVLASFLPSLAIILLKHSEQLNFDCAFDIK